ncbi:hypothetical protein, partial [Actinoplanes digitatis]
SGTGQPWDDAHQQEKGHPTPSRPVSLKRGNVCPRTKCNDCLGLHLTPPSESILLELKAGHCNDVDHSPKPFRLEPSRYPP